MELLRSRFWGTVLSEQAHVEMAIIRRAFSFLVSRCGSPCLWQVKQAVPMHALDTPDQEFRRAAQAEVLNLLGPKVDTPTSVTQTGKSESVRVAKSYLKE